MPVGKNLPFPLAPIWDPDKKTGSISTGNTPSTPPGVNTIAYLTQLAASVSQPQGIARVDDHVFIPGNVTSSLVSVDVSTPGSPAIAQTLTPLTGGAFNAVNANHIDTDGSTYVYVGSTQQLRVINITDPTNMVVTGTTASEATNLAVSTRVIYDAGYCYVSVFTGDRITVVDVSTPATPAVVGTVTDAQLDGCRSLVKSGDYLFVNCNAGYTVVDVSTPSTPTVVDHIASARTSRLFDVINGTTWFAVGAPGGVANTIDISAPTAISQVGTYTSPIGGSFQSALSVPTDRVVMLPSTGARCLVVDISTPSTPADVSQSATIAVLDEARQGVYSAGHIYCVDATFNGLVVLTAA